MGANSAPSMKEIGLGPSSTVRKIEWLSLNDLRKDKRALALHFVA
jgi:hypothetical protein